MQTPLLRDKFLPGWTGVFHRWWGTTVPYHDVRRGQLASRSLARLVVPAGGLVRCRSGRIWVSDDRGREAVLQAGELWWSATRSTVLVEALRAAEWEILPRDRVSSGPNTIRPPRSAGIVRR